jgi:hypothetical protein
MRTSLKLANFIRSLTVCVTTLLLPISTHAAGIEITPYIGQMISSDLTNSQDGTDLIVDGASNYGLALAWKDSPNGQGQVLFNTVSHDFISSSDSLEHSFDVSYLHFSGITQLKRQNYITTVSLGIGGTYIETDNKDDIYPSFTIAFGTRYELSKSFAIVTELRGYASYLKDDNQLFCQGTTCHALIEDSLWLEGSFSVGFAVKF